MCRYIGLDILAKSRMTLIETAESEEVTLTASPHRVQPKITRCRLHAPRGGT